MRKGTDIHYIYTFCIPCLCAYVATGLFAYVAKCAYVATDILDYTKYVFQAYVRTLRQTFGIKDIIDLVFQAQVRTLRQTLNICLPNICVYVATDLLDQGHNLIFVFQAILNPNFIVSGLISENILIVSEIMSERSKF